MEFLGAIAGRFAAYIDELTKVVAHADRAERLREYCAGLLVTEGRRSVEPMAAVTGQRRFLRSISDCCISLPMRHGLMSRCWPR